MDTVSALIRSMDFRVILVQSSCFTIRRLIRSKQYPFSMISSLKSVCVYLLLDLIRFKERASGHSDSRLLVGLRIDSAIERAATIDEHRRSYKAIVDTYSNFQRKWLLC